MRGMPILSGPPPVVESTSCRQCGRDFNPLWRRGKACGHCGYEYCSTCMGDGHALMPRQPGQHRQNAGPLNDLREFLGQQPQTPGYDVESVCGHCHPMLQVTAASVAALRTLPIKRLKEYLTAYDIKVVGMKEKEDVVQAVIKARSPSTGCLMPEHESYYRRRSVPRPADQDPPRPPPPAAQQRYQPRQRPPPPQQSRPAPQQQPRPPPPPQQARPSAPRAAPQPPRRPAQTSQQQHRSPPTTQSSRNPTPPVPTILGLVALPKSYLTTLSIGTLKAILYENHVRVDFKQVLEKSELIDRVYELVEDERKRLERQREAEQREAAEQEAARRARESQENGSNTPLDAAAPSLSPSPGSPPTTERPAPTGPAPDMDRGLCVVCQDEEAMLAVVDCGHLCMCQACSDLIMATSKECPLCRTRIVTPQRLIRIYRV